MAPIITTDLVDLRLAAGGGHHPRAGPGEAQGEGAADARGAADDHRHPPREAQRIGSHLGRTVAPASGACQVVRPLDRSVPPA